MKFSNTWVSLALLAAVGARAQDTRTVTEPVIPPVCTTLAAQLAGPIAEADEGKLDSERIQKAIDGCAAGHAVELAAQFVAFPKQDTTDGTDKRRIRTDRATAETTATRKANAEVLPLRVAQGLNDEMWGGS